MTDKIPEVTTQTMIDSGMNVFGLKLFIESIASKKDAKTFESMTFVYQGIEITLGPAKPKPKSKGGTVIEDRSNEIVINDGLDDEADDKAPAHFDTEADANGAYTHHEMNGDDFPIIEPRRMIKKDRWLCASCHKHFLLGELLEAPNPFDPDEKIYACPHCKTINDFTQLCDEAECNRNATCGVNTPTGYRRVCGTHYSTIKKDMGEYAREGGK